MFRSFLAAALAIAAAATPSIHATDDRLSIDGLASLAGQCQQVRGDDPAGDRCGAGLSVLPTVSFRPSPAHQLSATLGVGVGDALNDTTSFALGPWAADLERSIKDLDGTDRDALLTAWYRYTTTSAAGAELRVTAGIIDSTEFIDTNAYSNDEHTQFMNTALVNGPNAFTPSYAPGVAGEWRRRRLRLTAVAMRVGRTDGDRFSFLGLEVGYRLHTPLGRGTYRLLFDTTSRDFAPQTGASPVRRSAWLVSCDQRVGGSLGAFLRIVRQSEDASIEYRSLYSGGIGVDGAAWGRPADTLGLGYAHLTGGTLDVDGTDAAEVYYRLAVGSSLALTGDLQYMRDERIDGGTTAGLVVGVRVTKSF